MAWIESHQSLKEHPKLLDLCASMNWDQDRAIGKLHRLWWWCLDYAVDGDLRRFNDSQLALGMGVAIPEAKLVVEALVQARWLEREPYFRVRNWWHYVGRFLQIKWKNNENQWRRIRVLYSDTPLERALEPPLETPQAVQPNQPNLTNQPNLSCGPPGQSVSNPKTDRPIEVSPEEVYSAYPRKVGRPVALTAIKRAFKATPPAEVLAKTKAFAAATSQWPDDEKRFIPHPSTWFNQQRFNDDPETWKRSVPARPIAEIPVFVQIKHLEEAIAKHPANPESTFHRQDCTPDQQYDLREKRRKINELKAKQ